MRSVINSPHFAAKFTHITYISLQYLAARDTDRLLLLLTDTTFSISSVEILF